VNKIANQLLKNGFSSTCVALVFKTIHSDFKIGVDMVLQNSIKLLQQKHDSEVHIFSSN
jgi:hypothetical protein